jgi:AcrR family transcriptional regulator
MNVVEKSESPSCKRGYDLGKRLELMDRTRGAVLNAARAQLEAGGLRDFSMEALARAAGVTRQTIHNLFRTRSGVLEALFDQIAVQGGMQQMARVMQQRDPKLMLAGFIDVFANFWAGNRLLLRRVHGIAAIDPEFEAAVEARNRRRQMAASHLVDRLSSVASGSVALGWPESRKRRAVALLVTFTSFEFFDVLAENAGGSEAASALLHALVPQALAHVPEDAEDDGHIDMAAPARPGEPR